MRTTLSLLLALLSCGILFGQEADSLTKLYKLESNDSLKARLCLELGDYYEDRRINEAIRWGDRAVVHARKFKDPLFIVKALVYSSSYYNRKGNFHRQIDLCLEAMTIAEKENFYAQQGGIASNIGGAYIRLEDRDQAIHWLIRSIQLKKEYSTEEKLAVSIGNLGTYYFDLHEYEAAAEQQRIALEIRRKLGLDELVAVNLANLAGCQMMLKEYNEAETLYKEAYAIRTEADDQYGLNQILLDFSWLYERMGYPLKSIAYADSAYQLASSLNFNEFRHDAALQLGTVHKSIGNAKQGYGYLLEAYNLWQDMHHAEAIENLNELRAQYETEKVEGENILLRKDGEIKDLSIERNEIANANLRLVITVIAIAILVLITLVYFLNKWNREKRYRNTLLSEQKKVVEAKNDEILASIQYAKRIQAAILPQLSKVREHLTDSFVLYRPREAVSGDFYWLEHTEDRLFFAVADCTGHGVPGAMVSVVCNNGLNRSVREYGLRDPGKILDQTRTIVVNEFEKSQDDVQDGMDIALCCIAGNTLSFAGAHNPVWIVRNGEIIELKADKQPIGQFDSPKPYTTHTFPLEAGDTLYIFSDGFVDQFGGPKNKKFRTVNLKKLLLDIQRNSMEEQHTLLENAFDQWKGDEDQIDDVCVMGVRI